MKPSAVNSVVPTTVAAGAGAAAAAAAAASEPHRWASTLKARQSTQLQARAAHPSTLASRKAGSIRAALAEADQTQQRQRRASASRRRKAAAAATAALSGKPLLWEVSRLLNHRYSADEYAFASAVPLAPRPDVFQVQWKDAQFKPTWEPVHILGGYQDTMVATYMQDHMEKILKDQQAVIAHIAAEHQQREQLQQQQQQQGTEPASRDVRAARRKRPRAEGSAAPVPSTASGEPVAAGAARASQGLAASL